jgi:hypothetical protein
MLVAITDFSYRTENNLARAASEVCRVMVQDGLGTGTEPDRSSMDLRLRK